MGNRFILNNKEVSTDSSVSTRFIDILRYEFNLTGTKEACGEGECGACLVFVDGKIQNSCILPLNNVIDKNIITIDEYSKTEEYKKIEHAFLTCGAVQCGFCTPGMVMATGYLLQNIENPTDTEIKEFLSGNLCRCTGYATIIEAVKSLKKEV